MRAYTKRKINGEFFRIDQAMLWLQELLCAARKTHRADQVDILRRALNTIQSELRKEDK